MESLTEIEYRGNKGVLWKQNFLALFQKILPNIKLVKLQKFSYKEDPSLIDSAYVLKK